jgi:hypothetical protein
MNWIKETDDGGLPIWRGRDSIVNMHRLKAVELKGCGWPVAVVLLVAAVLMIGAGLSGGSAVDGLGVALGIIGLIGVAPVIYVLAQAEAGGGLSTREFFDEAWTLREIRTAEFHGLVFRREASESRPLETWRAPLAQIARVEAGGTQQWQSSRQLGNMLHEVTSYESQAFLFMGDGSRRVICSVNGHLEATGTLAESVRSWFETRKAQETLARQCADTRPAEERQEGFQL